MSRTVAEIEADIALARATKTAILTAGQEYSFDSGGSKRQTKMPTLKEVNDELSALKQELKDVQGESGTIVRSIW